jgi:hypothetical protein
VECITGPIDNSTIAGVEDQHIGRKKLSCGFSILGVMPTDGLLLQSGQHATMGAMSDLRDDRMIQRMKDALLRLRLIPEARVTTVEDDAAVDARESVRQLARSRVASILRQLRAVHGYSYEQVAEKTGLSQQLLFDVEYKDRRLSLAELQALAACYQISPGDVLGVDLEE